MVKRTKKKNAQHPIACYKYLKNCYIKPHYILEKWVNGIQYTVSRRFTDSSWIFSDQIIRLAHSTDQESISTRILNIRRSNQIPDLLSMY